MLQNSKSHNLTTKGCGWSGTILKFIKFKLYFSIIFKPGTQCLTMPQIRRVSCRHCALYKFTYLLIMLGTEKEEAVNSDLT